MRMLMVGAVMAMTAGVAVASEGPVIEGVWVTSSAAPDTSSVEGIVKDLVKPGMTDEEKVLAIFNWYRRVIYPHNYLASDRRDVLRQINSYGCTLCGSHAANLGWLMRAAGFKTRCAYIHGGGHTFIEVWYDNGWHAVDPETDFAVWSRGEHPHLISMEELSKDPTLLDNPEKEGRARAWLFKAMKFPWTDRKTMADYCDKNRLPKAAMQWSSSVLKGETIKDYFIHGTREKDAGRKSTSFWYSKENAAYGGHVSDPNLMHLTLRPHESLIRPWGNEGKGRFILGQGFEGYPAHLLYGGGADESDAEVFPYVEPYRKDNYGIPALAVDRCYRYSGNGHSVWKPTPAELLAAPGVKAENVTVDEKTGMLRPVEAGKPGTVEIPVRSSYALVWADITGTWQRGEGDSVRVMVWGNYESKDKKRIVQEWREAWTNDKTGKSETTVSYGKRINRLYDYKIRIELTAARDASQVGLKALTLDHTFVENWLVLPFLEPGKNTITVRLDNPEVLRQLKLTVTYEWEDGEGWKDPHRDVQNVTTSPFTYELDAKGPKYPRMKVLRLDVVPR